MFHRFNCVELCANLVDLGKMQEVKLILDQQESLRLPLIHQLSTPKYAKTATKLVLIYDLDPKQFPNLLAIVEKNSAIFFIRRIFKAHDHSEYMPIYKVEDILSDQPNMLSFLVEELIKHGDKGEKPDQHRMLWYTYAKGVYLRHNLAQHPTLLKPSIRQTLEEFMYEATQDQKWEDKFGPVTPGTVSLPEGVEVKLITDDEGCEELRSLIGKPVIGLDCEWRPNLTKFIKTNTAIL